MIIYGILVTIAAAAAMIMGDAFGLGAWWAALCGGVFGHGLACIGIGIYDRFS